MRRNRGKGFVDWRDNNNILQEYENRRLCKYNDRKQILTLLREVIQSEEPTSQLFVHSFNHLQDLCYD